MQVPFNVLQPGSGYTAGKPGSGFYRDQVSLKKSTHGFVQFDILEVQEELVVFAVYIKISLQVEASAEGR